MALNKAKIPISFSQGINTKVDEKQLQLGSFRSVENVVFDTLSKFRKRNGYDEIVLKKLDETLITDGEAVTTFLDELLLFTDREIYTYATSIDRWLNKGTALNVFPTSKVILRNSKEQKNIDCVSIENIDAFTYEDADGVKLSLRDNISGNFLLSNQVIDAAGSLPKIANIQNDIYIFYIKSSTELKYRKVNILFPTTIGSEVAIVADVDGTNTKYDTATVEDNIFIAYESSNSGGELTTLKILADGSATTAIGITGESASGALSVEIDSLNRLMVQYANSTDVKFLVRNTLNTTNLLAPTVLVTTSTVTNVIGIETTEDNYTIVYEVLGSDPSRNFISKVTCTIGGSVGSSSVIFKGLGLVSKMFAVEEAFYFLGVYDNTLQDTYFLINTDSQVAAKISPSLGGGTLTENGPCKVASLGDSKFLIGTQIKGRTVTDDGTFFSLLGVNSTVFDFALDDPYQNDALGENLHISAGFLSMYDGSTIAEHGFHLYPERVVAGSTATTGGSMGDGTYQYSAVYSWIDNKGQQHRSAPSVPISVTLAGATSTQTQEIEVETLRLTNRNDVTIEIYRTEAGGTVFYKITDTTSPLENDPAADSVTHVDTISDTDLIDNEILYTTGGVLDNIAAPASSLIKTFNNRIVLAGLEDENKIQYSKIRFEGRPVEFNDTLTINLVPDGGGITALEVMDEKLLIFKENALFYISGDGPNNLGQQDSFIEPEIVSGDVGCIDPNSTVLAPSGVFFKSNKGIYKVGRDLSIEYIGAPVEDFNNLKITSAEVVPQNNQIRFLTRTGMCLVYDYFVQQWVTFSNHEGKSATLVSDNSYHYLRSDSRLYKENFSSFSDNGTPIKLKINTGWLSLNGIQGFKRVYNMKLLGSFESEHKLKIRTAYDFKEAFIDEVTVDTSEFTDSTPYGGYSPYGDPSTQQYGGDGNVYQIKVNFKKQKCQSIKLTIEDIQDTAGEGLSLSNMLFETGVKRSAFKIDTDDQTFGTDTNTNG